MEEPHTFIFVGPTASGTTTAATMATDEIDGTASHLNLDDFVEAAYIDENGTEADGEDVERWATQKRRTEGYNHFASELVDVVDVAERPTLCISDVRSAAEMRTLRHAFEKTTVVALWTLPELRFKREYGVMPREGHSDYERFRERRTREATEYGLLQLFTNDAAHDYFVPNNDGRGQLSNRVQFVVEDVMDNNTTAETLNSPFEDSDAIEPFL